jgi:hypothetical protein
VRVIPDIKIKKEPGCTDPEGEYTFTDGCGNISIELSKLINEKLGLYICTAYQIRLGGAKGTLVCKPSIGQEVRMVELRPSMIKFKSPEYPLEVVRGSTFTQGYLNRQVILLMNCLGVPDDVFMTHLDNALNQLDVKIVISNLEKIYKKSRKQKKGRLELSQEMELFFGPSRMFGSIFKYALVRQFEIKAEQKVKAKSQPALLSQEEKEKIANSASNSQVDEIENLEKYRDTGIKPSGPLSEEMKD